MVLPEAQSFDFYRREIRKMSSSRALLHRQYACALIALLAAAAPPSANADQGHSHEPAPIGEPGSATAASRTVAIRLTDNRYEPESVEVKQGETIRFVLTNAGELLHEFNIGTAAMHAEHQKEMAVMAEHAMITATGINHEMMKMDHSKMGMKPMKHNDPNSVLVAPGEKKELVWKFTKDMDLEFACNVPGHYEAGMVGNIRFQR